VDRLEKRSDKTSKHSYDNNRNVYIFAYHKYYLGSDKLIEETVTLPIHECKRCGHRWIPRKEGLPVICPSCKSAYWNKERIR